MSMPPSHRLIWTAIATFLGMGNAMAVEEAKYDVLLQEEPFELREYAPHILAETVVEGGFEDAGSEAFGRLFEYISGHNARQQDVAMTSPVGQARESQEIDMTSPVGQQARAGKWVVSFMMPASFTLESAPEPKDPAVVLRRVPARQVAAVRYSGFWSEEGYQRNLAKLQDWIEGKGWRTEGDPVWARYDPPFMPWFLRRNEILVPVSVP